MRKYRPLDVDLICIHEQQIKVSEKLKLDFQKEIDRASASDSYEQIDDPRIKRILNIAQHMARTNKLISEHIEAIEHEQQTRAKKEVAL